ncbi:putative GTP cyclohydrolase 1 type 2 [Chlamydiales bacterium STE3]|nr:putative GTP cyclohydrolase 1 type 2 [Chlamydiales bacterium STE3]
MSITRSQLFKYLNDIYQSSLFLDFCPNGLQIEGNREIFKIATAVSASLETVQKAIEADVQALIVHHGLFWNRDSYVIAGSKREKIRLLLKHDISLFAYHLPMDAHQQMGNNWKAAYDLGLKELEPFCKTDGNFIGVKGTLKSILREEWQQKVENYYGHPATTAFGGSPTVSSVAIISGGAYRQMKDAAQEGLDAFVTGNFDEPAWSLAFEEKINFYALGHSATERVGPKALAQHLKEHLQLESLFLEDHNPF